MSSAIICIDAKEPSDLREAICAARSGVEVSTPGPEIVGQARAALVFKDLTELRSQFDRIENWLLGDSSNLPIPGPGLYYSPCIAQKPVIAFLYPGQGSQSHQMFGGLRTAWPEFDRKVVHIDQLWQTVGGESLLPLIYHSDSAFSKGLLRDTKYAQPAIGLVSTALRLSLQEIGIKADFHAGHSYGELSALCGAGVLDESMLLALSLERGRMLAQVGGGTAGSMLAIRDSYERVTALCAGLGKSLEVVNLNAPNQQVVAGESNSINALLEAALASGMPATRLNTSCAFHSSLMLPARPGWQSYLNHHLQVASMERLGTVYSNVSGSRYTGSKAKLIEVLSDHIVKPVRWTEICAGLQQSGANLFLEVGPGRTLTDLMVKNLAPGTPAIILPTDPLKTEARQSLLELLAKIMVSGVDVNWKSFSNQSVLCPEVQTYRKESKDVESASTVGHLAAANSKLLERYFAQQASLVRLAFQSADANQKTLIVNAALSANQNIMDRVLTLHEAAYLSETKDLPRESPATKIHEAKVETEQSASDVETVLRREIALVTGFAPEQIKRDVSFNDLGIDSLSLTEIWGRVVGKIPSLADKADRVFEVRSLADLDHLLKGEPVSQAAPEKCIGSFGTQGNLPSHGNWQQVRSSIVNAISIAKAIDLSKITTTSDFERDLKLDAFERDAIFKNFLYGHHRFGQAGRELLNASNLGDLDNLLARFDTSCSVRTEENTQRYVVQKKSVYVESERRQRRVPRHALVVGKKKANLSRVADVLSAAGVKVQKVHLANSKWHFGLTQISENAISDLQNATNNVCSGQAHTVFFVVEPPSHALNVDEPSAALFTLAKVLWSDSPVNHLADRLIIVGNETCGPLAKGALGVARSLRKELPRLSIRSVWLNQAPSQTRSDELVDLLLAENLESEIEEDSGNWTRSILVPQTVSNVARSNEPLLPGSRILLIGGGYGIGAELAVGLARTYKSSIIAVGRTAWLSEMPPAESPSESKEESPFKKEVATSAGALPHENRKQLARQRAIWRTKERIEAAGGTFAYHSADVSSPGALRSAIKAIRRRGPIHGVVHCAGFTKDNLLSKKSVAEFCAVVRTKAISAHLLPTLLKGEPLQFVFFLSSMSSMFGTAGQTDYAAANEILNSVAQTWNTRVSYPVKSLLWSVWTETGLASTALKSQMTRLGLPGITTQEGVDLFLAELRNGMKSDSRVLFSPPATLRFANGTTRDHVFVQASSIPLRTRAAGSCNTGTV